MAEVGQITGSISPKSIVHSGDGLFFAQNMMYRHTITVYDRDMELVATIPDTVDLSGFGHSGEYKGAPVEAAFSSDGSTAYVSNYQMYGPDSVARVMTAVATRGGTRASCTGSTRIHCRSPVCTR